MAVMIWLIRLACAVSAMTSSFEAIEFFSLFDGHFHQFGGVGDYLTVRLVTISAFNSSL